jgi:hypothetical protein
MVMVSNRESTNYYHQANKTYQTESTTIQMFTTGTNLFDITNYQPEENGRNLYEDDSRQRSNGES